MKKIYSYLFILLIMSTMLFACNTVEVSTDDPQTSGQLRSIDIKNITIPYEEVKDTKLSDIDYLDYTDAFDKLSKYLDSDNEVSYDFDVRNDWDIDTPRPDHYHGIITTTVTKEGEYLASYQYDVTITFYSESLRVNKGSMLIMQEQDNAYYGINLYENDDAFTMYYKAGTELHQVYAFYNQYNTLFNDQVKIEYYDDYLSFKLSGNEQKEYRVYKTEKTYREYDKKEEIGLDNGEDTHYYISVDRDDGYIRLIKNGDLVKQTLLKGFESGFEYQINDQEKLVFEFEDETTQYPTLYAYIEKEYDVVSSIIKTVKNENYIDYKDEETGELIRLEGNDTGEQCRVYLENTVPDEMTIPYSKYGKSLLNEIEASVYHRVFDENNYISYCDKIKYKVVVEDDMYKEDDSNAFFLAYYYDESNSYHHVFKKDIVASFAPVNTTTIYNAYDTSGYVNFTLMKDDWLEYNYINYSGDGVKSYVKLPDENETVDLYDRISDKNLSISNFKDYIVIKSEHSNDFNYKIYKAEQSMNLYNEYEFEYIKGGMKEVISLNNDQTGVTITNDEDTDTLLFTNGIIEKTYTSDSYTYLINADSDYSSEYVKVTLVKTNEVGIKYTIQKLLVK